MCQCSRQGACGRYRPGIGAGGGCRTFNASFPGHFGPIALCLPPSTRRLLLLRGAWARPAPERCGCDRRWAGKFLAKTTAKPGTVAGAAGINRLYGDGETGRREDLIRCSYQQSSSLDEKCRKERGRWFFFPLFSVSSHPGSLFFMSCFVSSSRHLHQLSNERLCCSYPFFPPPLFVLLPFSFFFAVLLSFLFLSQFFYLRSFRQHKRQRQHSNITVCLRLLLMTTKWNISVRG